MHQEHYRTQSTAVKIARELSKFIHDKKIYVIKGDERSSNWVLMLELEEDIDSIKYTTETITAIFKKGLKIY